MSSEAAIAVRNLSKEYALGLTGRTDSIATIIGQRLRHPIRGSGVKRERFFALDDVSFDVAHGEVVGVIGKNGAGKSTLLKILSRITPPSAGYIDMVGTVGSLLEVGTGFHPELTGIENVYLNGTILGMSKQAIDQRLEEIVAFAEVDKFLDTPVKRYSSGMRVRLAFAVAAHLDPEVLIIDEVLSVGDYGFQAKCLDKMRSIAADQGRTVLYVSHNLVTVEHLCPRSLLLVAGHLVFDGATQDTIAAYTNSFPHAERGEVVGVFDLGAAEREAKSEAIFKRLVLRPSGGPPSETVRMGERLQIEISVEGLHELQGANVVVAVGSSATPYLFRMTSRMRPLVASGERGEREMIVLDIAEIPLTPGEYFVDVVVWDLDATMIDHVHRAAEFTVIAADVIGTGYHFDARDGHLVTPWDWELRPASSDTASAPPDDALQSGSRPSFSSTSPGNRQE